MLHGHVCAFHVLHFCFSTPKDCAVFTDSYLWSPLDYSFSSTFHTSFIRQIYNLEAPKTVRKLQH